MKAALRTRLGVRRADIEWQWLTLLRRASDRQGRLVPWDWAMPDAAFSTIVEVIERASRRIGRKRAPLDRAIEYGTLIATLQAQVAAVAAERDAAVTEILSTEGSMSHRKLAAALGISAQRVDQLARIARAGGRPRQVP